MAEATRPPVITILGHVDHGKTTLLSYIRKTDMVAKEHGGITQAIGAYQVEVGGKLITFIDTPGHAAFEKMRSRGVQVADIAILVVAVDDGVMPQTVEAIEHIQQVKLPMIVAINKVDLPGVDIKVQLEKIKKQLSDRKVLVEEYGGDVPVVAVSAKTGQGVNELLEAINLVAEIHEFKGDLAKEALGVVIESHLDKYKGAVATILVRDGTLKKGDSLIVNGGKGRVRGMFDFSGKTVDEAYPSMPVEVLGWETVPPVGAMLGKEVATIKQQPIKTKSFLDKLKDQQRNVLSLVIKADTQGSLETVESSLEKFNRDECHIKIISAGSGEIVDSDVELASVTGAIVLGFNVAARPTAAKLAETEHVLIKTYNIIYELLEEIEDVVEGMIKPGMVEEVIGRAQIVAEFPFGRGDRIAGCKVVEGQVAKGSRIRILRGEEVVSETKIKSMKKLKDEVSKVEAGQDCGILFDPQVDFTIGDVIESYKSL